MLTAEQLLAGSHEVTEVEIPQALLGSRSNQDRRVRLQPLSIEDLRLISRAARDNDDLTAALMVQRALVEPELSAQQINAMSAGLLQFLLDQVNRISGIHVSEQELSEAMQDPLAQASVRLAQEFGWTPDQIGELTMGQVLMHLQMLQAPTDEFNA
ncbi:MAG: hypothetical protein GY802_01325 [Gammaproteobacteria bacterium]|nr:hypothetical protein [Gammaproteobacteria bacterium]MCP4386909.1 hypothetical protein [Gammaproteobacteria bacterium]